MRLPLTTIEMFVQKRDEALISTLALDQPRNVMDDVERVCPFIALRPPVIRTCPSPACVPRLHKSSCRVEDNKGVVHRTFSENHLFAGLVEQARENGDRKVVVYGNGIQG